MLRLSSSCALEWPRLLFAAGMGCSTVQAAVLQLLGALLYLAELGPLPGVCGTAAPVDTFWPCLVRHLAVCLKGDAGLLTVVCHVICQH